MSSSHPPTPGLLSASVLLDALGDEALLIDRRGRVAWINRPLERLLGIDRDAFHGSDANLFVRRYLNETCTERIAASPPDRHDVADLACTIRSSGGGERRIILSSRVLPDEPFRGMRLVRFRDVTERERAEQELHESESKYRSLVENSIDAVLLTAPDGSIYAANAEACRIFGMTEEELIRAGRAGVIDLSDPRLEPALEERALTGRFKGELRFRRKDGTVFPGEVSSALFTDRHGAVRTTMIIRDVTRRRRAEDGLRRSEERFRLLTENASELVVVLDPEGSILYASPSVKQVGGYEPEDLVGRNVLELTHPDDLLPVVNALSTAAVHPKERIVLEVRIRHASGDWLYLDIIGVNLLEEPAVRGYVVNARDVTERRRLETAVAAKSEELQRALNNLETTLNTIPAGVVIAEAGTEKILYYNPAAQDLLAAPVPGSGAGPVAGRPRSFRMLRPDRSAIPPEEWPLVRALRTFEETKNLEVIIQRADGTEVTTLVNCRPVLNRDGEIISAIASLVDLTERKRMEEELRESDAFRREIMDSMPVNIGVIDRDGVIIAVNKSWRTFAGDNAAPEEANAYVGDNYLAACAKAAGERDLPAAEARDGILAVLEGRRDQFYPEYPCHSPDVQRWFLMNVTPITGAGGGAVLFHLDITERKRAEEALRRHTDDLVRLNREVEAARDEANMYLDIMTHDVRNANNVSSMYADLLTDLAEGDLKTYTERLHASIERSSEILQNVSTIRRASEETGSLVPVNLDTVIRNEIASFPEATIRYDDPQVDVLADNLLPTVFANLIGNAVKFGGADMAITVRVLERDGEVLVSVEDTGPGVPDEVKTKLFTRFERGRAKGKGQGLGLFIVRTLVTRYGGKAWVDDRAPGRPEEGAAFRFTLRKAERHRAAAEPPGEGNSRPE